MAWKSSPPFASSCTSHSTALVWYIAFSFTMLSCSRDFMIVTSLSTRVRANDLRIRSGRMSMIFIANFSPVEISVHSRTVLKAPSPIDECQWISNFSVRSAGGTMSGSSWRAEKGENMGCMLMRARARRKGLLPPPQRTTPGWPCCWRPDGAAPGAAGAARATAAR